MSTVYYYCVLTRIVILESYQYVALMVHIEGLAFGTWKIEGESTTKFRVANIFIYYLAVPLPTLGHY